MRRRDRRGEVGFGRGESDSGAGSASSAPPLGAPVVQPSGTAPPAPGSPAATAIDPPVGAKPPSKLRWLEGVELYGGVMSAAALMQPQLRGCIILAPPGTGKTTMVERSNGGLIDADVIVKQLLAIPRKYSSGEGEKLVVWADNPQLDPLVRSAAHMVLSQYAVAHPEAPVMSGWLPPVELWQEIHPGRTVVMVPSVEWLLKRANSTDRKGRGHWEVSREDAIAAIKGFRELGLAVEAARAGMMVSEETTEEIFGLTLKGGSTNE